MMNKKFYFLIFVIIAVFLFLLGFWFLPKAHFSYKNNLFLAQLRSQASPSASLLTSYCEPKIIRERQAQVYCNIINLIAGAFWPFNPTKIRIKIDGKLFREYPTDSSWSGFPAISNTPLLFGFQRTNKNDLLILEQPRIEIVIFGASGEIIFRWEIPVEEPSIRLKRVSRHTLVVEYVNTLRQVVSSAAVSFRVLAK